MSESLSELTIRRAHAGDAPALVRLAALDSSHVPDGDVLVVAVGEEVRAALSLGDDGHLIADPFHRTAELVSVLRLRARQLRTDTEPRRRARGTLRAVARSA